ncbi:MAG: DNA-binding transcriptional regulator Fis [Psychrobacter sp.]|jgi:Fis family transcriptional regulator|uniref:Putative Fis-like DNA-binding protein n=1 Tax=Psychrobacter namhaensis TaxID=292734 RepID=A0ABW8LD43_9GAMM|nr:MULTISPECIES: DNA-binding transcriptional regulator Fis [Psychrobacter]MCD1280368.1 DNA-binding transcriptional regulator Fis [Psychrobacter sp. CCUG 69069]MCD6250755.1 DNA-binding transcriptional regulator Fis [Psychrobacter sp.]HCN16829.1 DNA-binding transcriptional regulator Fis [Psychrobacter sp.]|tara:strand:+ start:7445 stop:7807 length:363 start_codon:yes stop_codon:yes gene_type:complete
MAPHAQHNAQRFAKSSEHPADYNKDNYPHFTHDLSASLNSHATNMQEPLRVHVERVVRQYFAMLGDETPTDLYELILKQIEEPLLSVVLEQTRGNQTKCAQILGLNRGTLRKKLKTYDLM